MLDPQDHLSTADIADYLRGDLPPQRATAAEEHMSACLVCARQLRAEAQLEMLLFEAAQGEHAAPPLQRPAQPRAQWRRVATTALLTAAAAAAAVFALAPAGVASKSHEHATERHTSLDASSFINDAVCRPTDPEVDEEVCIEPLAVAMLTGMITDPEDYLSPFDVDPVRGWGPEDVRTSAMCFEDGPACDPSAR